jgi:nicotinate-nucleotide pyrophosphorylase (carboxylating)
VKRVPFEPLEPGLYRELVRRALAEDFGWGDVTTEAVIDRDQKARAVILAKADCVIAGLDIAAEAFKQLDPVVTIVRHRRDGEWAHSGTEVATLAGDASALLTAERTALNFMQRLSGIATLTRRFVEASRGRIVVLDTRKTTPGLRALEKYAVRAGGGVNHRGGLDQGILIKDNHIRLAGGVKNAVTRMRTVNREMATEVEAQSLDQVDDALAAGADIILLDNLSTAEITEAVRRCAGRAKTEISGGVTLARMPELVETGADYVSIGALTHSAPAVDLSFEIEPA